MRPRASGDHGGVASSGVPGTDLFLAPAPGLPRGLRIPATELVERFSRSSGPGGQHVNTTDSRVELVLDVGACSALTAGQRARAIRAHRLVWVVVASEHRSQYRNRVAARERLADMLARALAPSAPARRRTKPTRSSQARRLRTKRRRSQTKALRTRVRDDE